MRKLFIVFVLLAIGLCSSIALSFNANASTPNVTSQFKSMSHDASDVASLIDFSNYYDSITEDWEITHDSYWNYSNKQVSSVFEWSFINAGIFAQQGNDHLNGEMVCRFGKNTNSSITMLEDVNNVGGIAFYAATYGTTEVDATIQLLSSIDGGANWDLIDEINLTHDFTRYIYPCSFNEDVRFKFQQIAGQRLNIDDITILHNGDTQQPVIENCFHELLSDRADLATDRKGQFRLSGTYYSPQNITGTIYYSIDDGPWITLVSDISSEQVFNRTINVTFNAYIKLHTIRLAAQDLSGSHSEVVTVFSAYDINATRCDNLPTPEYTGQPVTFVPKLYNTETGDELTLIEDFTYDIDNELFGTVYIYIFGFYPEYVGYRTFTFEILPHTISGHAYLVDGTEYSFTGEPIKPSVVVVDDTFGELVEGIDYRVTYTNNTSIGQAMAIVMGYNHFDGTFELPFNIVGQTLNNEDYNILCEFYAQYHDQNALRDWDMTNASSAATNHGLVLEGDRVTKINLKSMGLAGEFPAVLLSLSKLKTLDLSFNELSGNAAGTVDQYLRQHPDLNPNLLELYINNNLFEGNLGELAASIKNLATLDASYNRFTDVSPMINPSVILDLSNQQLTMDFDITHGAETVIASIPSICYYNHISQYFVPLIELSFDFDYSLFMTIDKDTHSMSINGFYCDENGIQANCYSHLQSSSDDWYNKQQLSTVFSFAMGDANITGDISVTDLQAMINYIFKGYHSPAFNFTASNHNGDDILNVQDVVGEVNILLAQDPSKPSNSRLRIAPCGSQTMQASIFWNGDTLYLSNSVPVAALDIANAVDGNIRWIVDKLGMIASTAKTDNVEHTIIYSLCNAVIPAGVTPLAISSAGTGSVIAAMLSDVEAKEVSVKINKEESGLNELRGDKIICHIDGNSLTINTGCVKKDIDVTIYSVDGHVILNQHLPLLESDFTINLSNVINSNSYYIVVVRSAGQVITTQKLTQMR